MEIQNHPNYLIYPDGKVFSKKSNIFMKPCDNGTGYKYVSLYPGRKNITIHRLVAIHYIPNPENKSEVDHINRIRNDNRVENLRWVTHDENTENKGIQKRNNTGFNWITNMKTRTTYVYAFQRKNCKRGSSKNLSKMLCYSFFYLLKHPV
tara:strand:+ start:90 stop:539 length:450 start_codon:yes stop_codon:yes gene_type:complete